MVCGTFADKVVPVNSEIVDFGLLALVIIGFALAYDGITRFKK